MRSPSTMSMTMPVLPASVFCVACTATTGGVVTTG